jgi:hypothetical protein
MPPKDKEPTCVWSFKVRYGGKIHQTGCGLIREDWFKIDWMYCPYCGKKLEVKDVSKNN